MLLTLQQTLTVQWAISGTFLNQELRKELIPACYSSGCYCCGDPLQKSLRLRHFKLDRDEIWQCFTRQSDFRYDAILSRRRPWRHCSSGRLSTVLFTDSKFVH